MISVGSYEAKTHLPRLLDEVEAGETFVITKHGRPVARLVGVGRSERREGLVEAFRAAREGQYLGLDVAEAKAAGRR
ncbi:type II toxin-antitoxin system Phd/YefM family antitoxin [Aestuariimicrobium ganziense]|uniref:type II toxin-antitoxin system Phd/YefM family antitoxin n=1 Tax=Aestuariimicrobium ganziense TaxID=2773677 RepID=UPI0019431B5F|nr:type II toxin-antitoxin system prevent-host-death family antitoxin [Aestuariimicrobium ganziense]